MGRKTTYARIRRRQKKQLEPESKRIGRKVKQISSIPRKKKKK